MKVTEAQEYLAQGGVKATPETIRRWIKDGKLAGTLENRRYDVDEKALDAFIADQTGTPADKKKTPAAAKVTAPAKRAAKKPAKAHAKKTRRVTVSGKSAGKLTRKSVLAALADVADTELRRQLQTFLDTDVFGKGLYRFRTKLVASIEKGQLKLPEIDLSVDCSQFTKKSATDLTLADMGEVLVQYATKAVHN